MAIAMIAAIGKELSVVVADNVDALAEGKSRVVTFELSSLTDEEKDAVRQAVHVALVAIDTHVLPAIGMPASTRDPLKRH